MQREMALNPPSGETSDKEQSGKFFPNGATYITATGPWGPLTLPEMAKVANGLLVGQESNAKSNASTKSSWKWNLTTGQERNNKAAEPKTEAKQHEAWLIKSPMRQQTIHKALFNSPLTTEHQIAPPADYLGISPIVLRDYLDTCYPRRAAMILTHASETGQ